MVILTCYEDKSVSMLRPVEWNKFGVKWFWKDFVKTEIKSWSEQASVQEFCTDICDPQRIAMKMHWWASIGFSEIVGVRWWGVDSHKNHDSYLKFLNWFRTSKNLFFKCFSIFSSLLAMLTFVKHRCSKQCSNVSSDSPKLALASEKTRSTAIGGLRK